MQHFLQRCAQQGFSEVSHDATLCATVAEVELDPTSATVACNIARKVAPCVWAFTLLSTLVTCTVGVYSYPGQLTSYSPLNLYLMATNFNLKVANLYLAASGQMSKRVLSHCLRHRTYNFAMSQNYRQPYKKA